MPLRVGLTATEPDSAGQTIAGANLARRFVADQGVGTAGRYVEELDSPVAGGIGGGVRGLAGELHRDSGFVGSAAEDARTTRRNHGEFGAKRVEAGQNKFGR